MFILNQILGIGDFSITDNLRLIVIAAIFIGIIVVLLYFKSAKNGRKTRKEYVQAANSHDSSSKEDRHSADAEDDFLSIEEETEEVPVVNLGKTVADIEDMEREIDTEQEADIKDVRAEFATKIEGLISKIEESEQEVINKVENVVDIRVQEVLSKINDRIDEVLQAQKNSTDLVLEKMINSLRQKEEKVFNKIPEAIDDIDVTSKTLDTLPIEEKPVDTLSSLESEIVVEKTVKKKAATKKKIIPKDKVAKEKPFAKDKQEVKKKPAAVEGKSISSETLDTLPIEEKPVGIKPSKKSKQSRNVVAKKVESEEITERNLATPDEDSDILEELASSLEMEGSSLGFSFPDQSGDTEEVAEVPVKTKEEDMEISSEVKEDITAEEEGQIASAEKIEKSRSGEMEGESDDLDILDFLKEDSIGISLPDESNANEEIAELSEEIKGESLEETSEVNDDEKIEEEESITSSEEKEENVSEVDEGDSTDFDIQEFLDELENLPSEKDLEGEK